MNQCLCGTETSFAFFRGSVRVVQIEQQPKTEKSATTIYDNIRIIMMMVAKQKKLLKTRINMGQLAIEKELFFSREATIITL